MRALVNGAKNAVQVPHQERDHILRFPVEPAGQVPLGEQAKNLGTGSAVLVPALGGR
jgi:hypothetical protein